MFDNVEKKLREARFFLGKMIEQESIAFGEKEPFDFYLSAFLSAGRTVDYRLRHEHRAIYPTWRDGWNNTLNPTQQGLIKFMIDDRNVEVHESGSSRTVQTEEIKVGVGNTYSDKSGTLQVMGSPWTDPATINKPTYNFTITGIERKATEACGEYLALLEQMVAGFVKSQENRL
jgi:hypothetical protein